MNSALQCLAHTGLFVLKILRDRHIGPCPNGTKGFCSYCSVQHHISEVMRFSGTVMYPNKFVNLLKLICPGFKKKQHQDAHEFLRILFEKLDDDFVAASASFEPEESEHEKCSIVKEVFGGQLQCKLQCPKCGHEPDKFEDFEDLNLNVEPTLVEALSSYTKIEVLEDASICESCKCSVNREKCLKVKKAPEVLVIQLKRFQALGDHISKIDGMVEYPVELDLNPFMSSPKDKPEKYDLYGIVQHEGDTNLGHYVSYIRPSKTDWFLFNDAKVTKMTEDSILDKQAYILFYVKKGSSPWFSTLLGDKYMLDKNWDLGVVSNTGTYDSSSGEEDMWEHCIDGQAKQNEAPFVVHDGSSSKVHDTCSHGGSSNEYVETLTVHKDGMIGSPARSSHACRRADTSRMGTGLDGEATEPVIKELEEEREESQDP